MATVVELRDRLRRPLERELATGCHDDVVVGGLERLVATVGRPFADVQELLTGYAELAPTERADRLAAALRCLEPPPDAPGGRAAPAAPGAGTKAPPEAPADVADGADVDALLDAPLADRTVDLGAQAARKLAEVGLTTYRDVLMHAPRRWEDRRALPSFAAIHGLERATVVGTVVGRKLVPTRRGAGVLRAVLEDGAGARLTAVWFHQPWVERQLFPGQRAIVTGRVKLRGRTTELHVEGFEVDDEGPSLSTGRVVAVYPSTQGLSQAYLRRAVDRTLAALPRLPDPLPARLCTELDLVHADRAWRDVHQPPDEQALQRALRRLKFDEFLMLELRVLLQRDGSVGRTTASTPDDEATFLGALPFALTGAQERALAEVRADLARPRQMARLLMGDVGTGKTAVAAGAAWTVVRGGAQVAIMAPTELLARQHLTSFTSLLWPLGVTVDLLVGGLGAAERRAVRARVASGGVHVVVGTHALIQEGVAFRDLGLAVIDEEHRFGVDQRRTLIRDAPDVLVMTATPIPRSLALTQYGDLDVSVLDERPPGRTAVATELRRGADRPAVYRRVAEAVAAGRQAYVVAPLVEDSEALDEIVSATALHDELRVLLPPEVRLGLVHGRLAPAEKDGVMEAFRAHRVDVLVATTVVEVGVDVPNATMVVIENAERFGLAQLHQLRGRVGRGAHPGRCVLVAGEAGRTTMTRLRVVERHTDGFLIAEEDLRLRGPGELRGTRQSGMPDLSFGDLVTDVAVIEQAREVAQRMLVASPRLDAPWAERLRAMLQRTERAIGFRQTL
ncbi:MAG: ATP-dependent DNA helicase RecG [Trueperaceae bacterium]